MRKHVERASHDLRAVITTYEGKHNHDVPAPRGSGSYAINRPPTTNNGNTNNNYGLMAIRPSANYSSSLQSTAGLTTNGGQPPYTLQMLQNSGSNGLPESSYVNQNRGKNGSLSSAKEEPEDELFYNSFLGWWKENDQRIKGSKDELVLWCNLVGNCICCIIDNKKLEIFFG